MPKGRKGLSKKERNIVISIVFGGIIIAILYALVEDFIDKYPWVIGLVCFFILVAIIGAGLGLGLGWLIDKIRQRRRGDGFQ